MDFLIIFISLLVFLVLAFVGLLTIALITKIRSPICQSKARLDRKTVVVTGANTGIGKVTAEELARRGARVYLACRNVEKAQQAADDIRSRLDDGSSIKVMQLDLASLRSVRKFVEDFKNVENRLDILVNNAGVGWLPERTVTEDGLELIMASNHFGHFFLTNLLLDLLKASAPSRIINVSSLAHTLGKINFDDLNYEKKYPRMKVYADSKLANVYFTKELSNRLEGTGVTVCALHPGTINSDFPRNVSIAQNRLVAPFMSMFMKTTWQGAQTSIYCSVAEELETVSGKYYSDCAEMKCGKTANDTEAAQRLWDASERLVGLVQ